MVSLKHFGALVMLHAELSFSSSVLIVMKRGERKVNEFIGRSCCVGRYGPRDLTLGPRKLLTNTKMDDLGL